MEELQGIWHKMGQTWLIDNKIIGDNCATRTYNHRTAADIR